MKSRGNRLFSFCFWSILTFVAHVWAAPTITTQPVDRLVATMGGYATLGVSASGSGNLRFQWFHNGMAVTGGTFSSLTLAKVKFADTGAYQVQVTDSNGVATSAAGFLNVSMMHSAVVAWGDNSTGQSAVPLGLSGVVAIAAGDFHSLALKSDGTVVSWGNSCEVGDLTVPPGLTGVVAIAAKYYRSMALISDGTVVAWGSNHHGEGTVPAGLSGAIAIAAGNDHSLALKSDGTVVAWGYNGNGQGSVPTGLIGVVAIAAGDSHNLALKSDGTVVAWGAYFNGQTTVPAGLSGVIAIAAGGNQSLALKSDGTAVIWGYNGYGQSTVPTGLNGVTAISLGYYCGLALKSDGTVVNWGPISIPPPGWLSGVAAISAGCFHNLALQEAQNPSVLTQPAAVNVNIGDNATLNVTASGGQLAYQWRKNGVAISSGTGATYTISNAQRSDEGSYDVVITNPAGTVSSNLATLTVGGPTVTAQPVQSQVLTMGENATISVSASGVGDVSYQWFHNGVAMVGGTSSSLTLSNVKCADVGGYRVKMTDSTGFVTSTASLLYALPEPAAVVAWGSGISVPAGLSSVVAIASKDYHSLALKSDGTVVDWVNSCTPPAALSGVVAIAAGYWHSVAVKSDGTVVAWGDYNQGQTAIPSGLSGVVAIAAGDYHSLALKSDGTVVAWGDNTFGECTVPSGLSGVIAIAAGGFQSMALKSDGTVVAWGDNYYGECTVPNGLSGVVAVATESSHSLALKSDGTVAAWGRNTSGEGTAPLGLCGVVGIAAGGSYNLALQEPPPAAPTTVSASNNDPLCAGSVHLTWAAVAGASCYQVSRSTNATGDKVAISAWQSDTNYYDTTATSGAIYFYWVAAATDASGANSSGFGSYDKGVASFTASETAFSNWMAAHGLSGLPAPTFAADRDGDGVANGLKYAFGANRQAGEPSVVITTNGSYRVGILKQADETLPFVGLAVKCSTDLQDWTYPLVPVTDSTGLDVNRTWYQPQGSPAKVFFRLEATLKP